MKEIPVKITRPVFIYGKLRIRFHLKLSEDVHREFSFGGKLYSSLNTMGFLTIEHTENQSFEDGNTASIMITDKNIYSVISALSDAIKNLYTYDIYYKEGGVLRLYEDEVDKYTVARKLYGGGVLMLRPSIIYDENETSYEGVTLFINSTNNNIDIPLEALEAVRYSLSKVDFFLYSQSMLNYYIYYYGVDKDNALPTDANSYKPRVNWIENEPPKVETRATYRKEKDEFGAMFNGTL